jgi:uncharacterized protein DUF6190
MPAETLGVSAEHFVDATVFLGMHSTDPDLRRACKYFFAHRFADRMVMSLEQVGRCDDIVWRFPRKAQDAYYPFMDHLHTEMDFVRIGYSTDDVYRAQQSADLAGLPMSERLLLSMVCNQGGTLYSLNPRLLDRPDLPVRPPVLPPGADRITFHPALEELYRTSLALRVDMHKL